MIRKLFQKYVVDALSHMALGLFCSLILGLIISQIAKIPSLEFLTPIASALSATSQLVGACIGLAIAMGLKCDMLVTISSAVVGAIGYKFGGPVGSYLTVIIGAELGGLISKKTPVDIILTPMLTIVAGGLFAQYCCSPINDFMVYLGSLINSATELNPLLMGIVVATIVGCALTLPISSAALCIMLQIDGLAAGAATAGCCAQMIGFAVISFKDNGVGGLISQGIGTSMLQIGNIARKPIIWLAPTLTSAIMGPVSTMIFEMKNTPIGAGMGTAGLVGPIDTYATMSATTPSGILIAEIIGLYIIAPAIVCYLIHMVMVRRGWVKAGDMKLKKC